MALCHDLVTVIIASHFVHQENGPYLYGAPGLVTATLGQRRNRWRNFLKFWYRQWPGYGAKNELTRTIFLIQIMYISG